MIAPNTFCAITEIIVVIHVIGRGAVSGGEIVIPNRAAVNLAILAIEARGAYHNVNVFEEFKAYVRINDRFQIEILAYLLDITGADRVLCHAQMVFDSNTLSVGGILRLIDTEAMPQGGGNVGRTGIGTSIAFNDIVPLGGIDIHAGIVLGGRFTKLVAAYVGAVEIYVHEHGIQCVLQPKLLGKSKHHVIADQGGIVHIGDQAEALALPHAEQIRVGAEFDVIGLFGTAGGRITSNEHRSLVVGNRSKRTALFIHRNNRTADIVVNINAVSTLDINTGNIVGTAICFSLIFEISPGGSDRIRFHNANTHKHQGGQQAQGGTEKSQLQVHTYSPQINITQIFYHKDTPLVNISFHLHRITKYLLEAINNFSSKNYFPIEILAKMCIIVYEKRCEYKEYRL